MSAAATDPTGQLFVSYRRSRAAEIADVVNALHDRGVPTWLDTRNLPPEPTADALRRILSDPTTAAALMYLTPEVQSSPTIKDIEAPAIMRRYAAGDAFWVQPVAAGGLDYAAAAGVAAGRLGAEDLNRWNIMRITGDPATATDADAVAKACLRRRLQAVHAALPPGAPLTIRVHARGTAARQPGDALVVDWSRHFAAGGTSAPSWLAMTAAVRDAASAVRLHCPGRDVIAAGTPGLPAAVLLGAAFPTRDSARLSWSQRQPDGTVGLPWGIDAAAGPADADASGWRAAAAAHDPAADACAVLVDVNDDTSAAFSASRADLPPWRAVVRIGRPGVPATLDAREAASLAWLVMQAVRAARTDLGPFASVHLFIAAPAGFAVMLGTLLATLPPVTTYEYDSAASCYRPGAQIRP